MSCAKFKVTMEAPKFWTNAGSWPYMKRIRVLKMMEGSVMRWKTAEKLWLPMQWSQKVGAETKLDLKCRGEAYKLSP